MCMACEKGISHEISTINLFPVSFIQLYLIFMVTIDTLPALMWRREHFFSLMMSWSNWPMQFLLFNICTVKLVWFWNVWIFEQYFSSITVFLYFTSTMTDRWLNWETFLLDVLDIFTYLICDNFDLDPFMCFLEIIRYLFELLAYCFAKGGQKIFRNRFGLVFFYQNLIYMHYISNKFFQSFFVIVLFCTLI